MRIELKRFYEEFFLYSSQFVVFFIVALFLSPSIDALRPVSLLIVCLFLAAQISLLVVQGHKPLLRFVFSFITPAGYVLVRALSGTFMPFDMANVFLWGAALYVGILQAIALSSWGRWIKNAAETLLAIGVVLVFVFFFFYLDLRFSVTHEGFGPLSPADFEAALGVKGFAPAFVKFIETPKNGFLVVGAFTFGVLLLANKVKVQNLRSRLATLFDAARIDERSASPDQAAGQQALVTVLSADIRDFTGLADKVTAEKAVGILNRYYSLWAVAAERRGGRLAGLAGDSVLVVFGLLGEKDAAERALACARDFLGELPGMRDDLLSAALPAIEGVSIGIHSGSIVAGELGIVGSRRLGVFGDAVSVAARLDSLCREFNQDLLLSQTTFRQLDLESQAKLVRIGEVLLRNRTQPMPVYGNK